MKYEALKKFALDNKIQLPPELEEAWKKYTFLKEAGFPKIDLLGNKTSKTYQLEKRHFSIDIYFTQNPSDQCFYRLWMIYWFNFSCYLACDGFLRASFVHFPLK